MQNPHDCSHTPWVTEALRHQTALMRYACRVLGRSDGTHDIVQECYARLLRSGGPQSDNASAAWLYRVCRNLALDLLRKEERVDAFMTDPDRDEGRVPIDPASQAESRDTLARALSELEKLSPQQREVVRLKFQSGLSYREIHEVTGIAIGTIGSLLHEALASLRRRLNHDRLEGLTQ